MSSIVENSETSLVQKRSFFLRSGSIQKIKCSATYPFRLAGAKLNREAIRKLIEIIIIIGRELSLEVLLNLYIATYKLIGAICCLWYKFYFNKVCDESKKTDKNSSFQQRLLEKIQKIQNHKNKLDAKPNSLRKASIKMTKQDNSSSENKCEESSKGLPSSSPSPKVLNESVQNVRSKDYMLSYVVYGSVALIFLQLGLLTVALNTTKLPPGLIFLITSLFLIAIIAFKVFFVANMKRIQMRNKEVENFSNGKCSDLKETRQSRDKLKKVLDLNSKTLSKIKLL